jgi:hypothetical protein
VTFWGVSSTGRHLVRGEVDSQALATGAWPSQVGLCSATMRKVACHESQHIYHTHHRPVHAPRGAGVALFVDVLEPPHGATGGNLLGKLEGLIVVATQDEER